MLELQTDKEYIFQRNAIFVSHPNKFVAMISRIVIIAVVLIQHGTTVIRISEYETEINNQSNNNIIKYNYYWIDGSMMIPLKDRNYWFTLPSCV